MSDEAVAVSFADFQTLTSLGATYAEGVVPSIADTAANIVAAAADLVDADGVAIAPIAVSDVAPVLTVADLVVLQSLAATFAATPSVADTLAGADGVVIGGVDGVSLSVGSVTPGADAIEATIVAAGTGTITFDFADADDTVTLLAGSAISGFTTLAVVAGTVDVSAANIGAEVSVVEVNSGIVMTAAQFLALDAVTAGSETSDITIIVANNTQAQAVIAQAGKVTLAEGATFEFVNAVGGQFNAAQKAAADADFLQAYETATAESALPQAISNLLAAETAQADFVPPTVATLKANGLDTDGNGNVVVTAKSTFTEVADYIGFRVGELEAAVDNAAAGPATIYGAGAFINGDAALQADIIAALDTALAKEVTDAGKAVTTAYTAVGDNGLANQTKELFDLVQIADAANDAFREARGNTIGEYVEVSPGRFLPDQTGTLQEPVTTVMIADNAVTMAAFYVSSTSGSLGVEINGSDLVEGYFTTFAVLNVGKTAYNLTGTTVAATAEGYVLTVVVDADRNTAEITVPKADFDALLSGAFEVQALRTARDAADEAVDAGLIALNEATPPGDADYQFDLNGDLEVVGGGDDAGTAYWDSLSAQKFAIEKQAEFDSNIADWTVLNGLNDDAVALEKSYDAAEDAIQNAPDAVAPETPGLGITIVHAEAASGVLNFEGVDVREIYFFDKADAAALTKAITVSDFGNGGADYVYMGAGVYTFVELGATQTIANNLGSGSVLEIFAREVGNDVQLYVEQVATAGNGSTGADFVTLDIMAAEIADLAFNAETGILTAEVVPPVV